MGMFIAILQASQIENVVTISYWTSFEWASVLICTLFFMNWQ